MPKYSPGNPIRVASSPDRTGTVVSVELVHGGIQYYRVMIDRSIKTMPEADLVPFVEAKDILASLINGPLGYVEDLQRLLTFNRLFRDRPLLNHIYAFNASRTRFYPHQFKPLVKFLESPNYRILVADEVGLGKTIEAGLILTELEARQDVDRVLIVCPANLTQKWKLEMRSRFGQDFRIHKAKEFREFLDEFESASIPPEMRAIVSLESIRTSSVTERLEAVRPDLDLVIIDEAHHLRNFGRRQRRAGDILSELSLAMVFLTATPVQLGQQDLYSLLNLLEPDEFRDKDATLALFRANEPLVRAQFFVSRSPARAAEAKEEVVRAAATVERVRTHPELQLLYEDIAEIERSAGQPRAAAVVAAQKRLAAINLLSHIFTRTRKRDVFSEAGRRKAYPWKVLFSERERQFYDAVTDFVRAEAVNRTDVPVIQQWILNTPQRRMASSIPAMIDYYKKYVGPGLGEDAEDTFYTDDDPQQNPDLATARQHLQAVITKWPEAQIDSKYEVFKQILEFNRQERDKVKVLVFAFFKDTLYYLKRRLAADGYGVAMISGDDAPDDRGPIILDFKNNPKLEVLLSSRVGSEGLDFQFCSTLVNYDLPWNPMEIEQRIGRIDRLGQEAEVIDIHNLSVEGTIEERILTRLFQRIGVFERSVGDIEAILGDEWRQLERDLLSIARSQEDIDHRIDQAAVAFESRMRDLNDLEQNTAQFVGTDEYFEHEIKAIKDRYRYVTGKQLYDYVRCFLESECPKTRLRYDQERESGIVKPDGDLHSFITRRGQGAALRHFLTAPADGIALTFDRDRAFEDPRIEFINVTHPLVQAITEHYRDGQQSFTTAHHVGLRTDALPPGTYVYFIWRLMITAARSYNSLEMVVLDSAGNEAVAAGDAERIMGLILQEGMNPSQHDLEVQADAVRAAHDRAYGIFMSRVRGIRREKEFTNQGYIDRRVASLEAHYGKNIGALRQQLGQAERRDAADNYLRMIRGKLRKAEAEREAKLQAIRDSRQVAEEIDGLASGILEILAP